MNKVKCRFMIYLKSLSSKITDGPNLKIVKDKGDTTAKKKKCRSQCLLRRHNFFLVCQQKISIPRLFLVFLIISKRNWNKLSSCLRDFYVSNIFQKQLDNLFQFHQKSSKKAIRLLKNIGLAWHTQKKLKQASGTVWATWQKPAEIHYFFR